MDPNEALSNARLALVTYRANPGDHYDPAAERLADAFEALDEWLTNGGFLPRDWHQ